MAVNTSTGLSQEMSTYYEKVFLDRAMYEYVYQEGLQKRRMPANEGKQINFTRYTPLATVTTALSEGVNPSEVALTASTVSAALAEYGTTVKISRFLSLTSIDEENEEKISVVAQNMGETLDELTRNELFTGATVQFAGAKAALTDLSASNVLSVAEIRKAVRTLKKNKAQRYGEKGRSWILKAGPDTTYDLTLDSTFISADIYSNNAEKLYTGELGTILGARVLESPNQKSESSTATVFSNFIHGQNAAGTIDLAADQPKLYIIPHTQVDSGNPAGRFSLVSWAGATTNKTLNSGWLINIKTGAS